MMCSLILWLWGILADRLPVHLTTTLVGDEYDVVFRWDTSRWSLGDDTMIVRKLRDQVEADERHFLSDVIDVIQHLKHKPS